MRQVCDLGVKVIVVRPGIGTSENVNKTHSYPQTTSTNFLLRF